jgi:hypothetical protein
MHRQVWRWVTTLAATLGGALVALPAAGAPPDGQTQPVSPEAIVANLLVYAVVPTAVFAGLAGGLAALVARIPTLHRLRPLAGRVFAATGVVLAVLAVVPLVPSFMGGQPPWVGIGGGFVALGVALAVAPDEQTTDLRFSIAAAALAMVVAVGLTVLQAAFTPMLTRATTTRVVFVVSLFGLLPVGHAAGRGDTSLATVLAAAAFGVPMAAYTLVALPGFGLGLLWLVAIAVYGGGILLVGSPVLAIGAALEKSADN